MWDVHGLAGNDSLAAYGSGHYTLYGDAGNDSLYFSGTGHADLEGGKGIDMLYASGPGTTTMEGGAGADSFVWYGGAGHIVMNGGSGVDTYDLNAGAGNVTITHLGHGEHIDVWGAGDVSFVEDTDHSFMIVNPDGSVGHVDMDGHHIHMFTDGTVVLHAEGIDGKG